jgi:PLP dependent protein
MNTFVPSLQAVHAKITAALARAKRPDTVILVAVSKTQPAEKIREAYLAGQTHFGENYLQEALDKQKQLQDCAIVWHFIGPIQSNKTTLIAEHFDWVHSVDRLKVAQRLASARPSHLPPLNICIQINSSLEDSKSGVAAEELKSFAEAISQMPQLKLRGLMAIPAPTNDEILQRAQFKIVHDAFVNLQQFEHKIDTLSIGMSTDFEAAILEGATMIRVGSALFGARPVKNLVNN